MDANIFYVLLFGAALLVLRLLGHIADSLRRIEERFEEHFPTRDETLSDLEHGE